MSILRHFLSRTLSCTPSTESGPAASFINVMSTDSTASSDYVAGSASIAYVTVADSDAAKQLARGLIEANLAACVNVVPSITSIYRWQGAVQEDSEVLLMIKTMTNRVPDLCAYVRSHHSYEVAEVIAVPIADGNPPYMNFIKEAFK